MVGVKGEAKSMQEEGEWKSSCGGGVGTREEGDDGEGDGMESYKKKGSSKKKNSQKCGRILKWMC